MENSNLLEGIAEENLDTDLKVDEIKLPMLVKSALDEEDTIFEWKKTRDTRQSRNMVAINIILIVFGLLSIAFIVRLLHLYLNVCHKLFDVRAAGNDGQPWTWNPRRAHTGPPHQSLRRHHGLGLLPGPELFIHQPEHFPCHQHFLRDCHLPEHGVGECHRLTVHTVTV